jgi:hypothetical protein
MLVTPLHPDEKVLPLHFLGAIVKEKLFYLDEKMVSSIIQKENTNACLLFLKVGK